MDEQLVRRRDVHQGVPGRRVAPFVFLGDDGVLQDREVGDVDPVQVRCRIEIGQPVRRAVELVDVVEQLIGGDDAAVEIQVEAAPGKARQMYAHGRLLAGAHC
jgi:hypothetical protein